MVGGVKAVILLLVVVCVGCGKGDAEHAARKKMVIEKVLINVDAKNYKDALLALAEYQGSDKSQIQAKVGELIKRRKDQLITDETTADSSQLLLDQINFAPGSSSVADARARLKKHQELGIEASIRYFETRKDLENGKFKLRNNNTENEQSILPVEKQLTISEIIKEQLKQYKGEGVVITMNDMRNIKTLNLYGYQITDADLKEVAKLKNLTFLNLRETQITDIGLKEVANLRSLTEVILWRTQITKAGADKLRKALPNCRVNF